MAKRVKLCTTTTKTNNNGFVGTGGQRKTDGFSVHRFVVKSSEKISMMISMSWRAVGANLARIGARGGPRAWGPQWTPMNPERDRIQLPVGASNHRWRNLPKQLGKTKPWRAMLEPIKMWTVPCSCFPWKFQRRQIRPVMSTPDGPLEWIEQANCLSGVEIIVEYFPLQWSTGTGIPGSGILGFRFGENVPVSAHRNRNNFTKVL